MILGALMLAGAAIVFWDSMVVFERTDRITPFHNLAGAGLLVIGFMSFVHGLAQLFL